jgi:hypothetical protein
VVDKSRLNAVRKKQQELLGLLNEWNPIGVMPGAPSDEYDCLLGLLGRLQRGDEPGKLSRYLRRRLSHHFGLNPDPSQPEQFAERVFAWYWADPLPGSFRGYLLAYLLATTVLFFGLGILGLIVTLGFDDSIGGRIISGAMTVAFFYFGVRRLRLLRVH